MAFRGEKMVFDSKARDRYNEATYARYTIRIHKEKDSDVYERVEEFMSHKNSSLSFLVTKLLRQWFYEND